MSSSEPDWKQLILTLFGAYQREASPESISAYVIAVVDIPYPFVKQAVIDAIRGSKWMPAAAELRAAAKKLMPKTRDPYLQKLLNDGRQRQPRLTDRRTYQQTMATYKPERPRISDTEIEQRRQAFLNQLPTE